jgi:chemosensory pili system protein ChpA (sensor histidine kinase/response regulator)
MDLSNKPGKEKKTVLIVEDSQAQALALASLLESQGLNVLSAPNGVEGFCLARKHIPDMVILDIFLPDLSGMKVCYMLRQDPKTNQIPVVLLTSKPRQELREESLETAGAVEFVPKDAFTEVVLLELLLKLNIIEEKSRPT